jgi:hypothetical protein
MPPKQSNVQQIHHTSMGQGFSVLRPAQEYFIYMETSPKKSSPLQQQQQQHSSHTYKSEAQTFINSQSSQLNTKVQSSRTSTKLKGE